MRHLSVTFPPSDTSGASVYADLVPEAPGRRAALVNLDVLDDGTTLELVHVEGPRAAVVAELERRDNLLDFEVFGSGGGTHYVYQHVDQRDRLLALLDLLREHRLLIDFPITYGDHGVTVRLVGPEESIQAAFDELPAEVRTELVVDRIRPFVPESHDLRARLTDRQREVLEVAVATGYYADPRRTTVEGVADEIGISQATASEHLRRIEARVLGAMA